MDYIPIVISFDKKYLFYAKIAVNFILNRTKRKIKLYALALDVDDSDCSYFKELLEKNSGQFEKVNFKLEELKDFREMHHFGKATYLRLFIPKFVKEDKAIYMDCDVMAFCDVGELYDIEFDGALVIASEDATSLFREKYEYNRSEVLDLSDTYFNAGLIVLNNKSIREMDFEKQIQEINKKYYNQIHFADQCIFNKLLEGKKKIIDFNWNYQFDSFEIDISKVQNVKFAHSVGYHKSWHNKDVIIKENKKIWIREVLSSGFKLEDIFKETYKDYWKDLHSRLESNMENEIKLVFCFDNKYLEYARIAIRSLLKNKTRNVFIYMIVTGLKEEDLVDIISLIYSFDSRYKIFYVDYSKLNFCKPMEHLKMPTYLRLLIPSLISEQKIIYLDCDIYVNGDLGELFDLNIGDNVIAVAKDDHGQPCKDKLNLKNEYYSNAGVLRWDLDKVNKETFLEECKEVYLKYEKSLTFGDQCILNILYDNKKTTISREWNEQVIVNYAYYPVLEYFIEQKRKIIHFCGPVKPWECDFGNAGWRFWHKYMA